jgi:glycosyltransferase involved in cell wall biosynthesis
MPKVSVIIPSYNHEKYIAEAIQSILNQTYQDFEIIITDDGSKDNTVKIIKSFTDSRIKLFCFSQNQGAAAAANQCIAESKGEFIALLNSDDAWVPEKLERQVNFLGTNLEIGAVFSYAQFIDENSNKITNPLKIKYIDFIMENRTRFEWLNYFFYHGNCLCHPSILIRKECYNTIGVYDRRLAQLPDFDFWIRLCQKYEIYVMPQKLVNFRIRDHEANVSGYKPESYTRMDVELPQVYKNYLNDIFSEDILKIFPELNKNYSIKLDFMDKEILFFGIGKIALESNLFPIQYFGLETIYKLLENSNIVDKICQIYNFSFVDLIKINGRKPIFLNQTILDTNMLIENSKVWKIWNKWIKLKQKLGF